MNFLKGAQFRVPKHQFPNHDGYEYGDWQDCTDQNQLFPRATQFRMKPEMLYYVGATKYDSLDKALHDLSYKMSKGGQRITVMTEERKLDFNLEMASHNVQYANIVTNTDWTWKPMGDFRTAGYEFDVRFRVRPDCYWRVTTRNGPQASGGTKDFHDVELLNKFWTNQILTDRIDQWTMHKVAY